VSADPVGHCPTLGDYLRWARGFGCAVQTGFVRINSALVTTTRIQSPDGSRSVLDIGTEQTDYLAPSMVGRFDRRLGVRSPFPSVPSYDRD
jgi:hypothetical protein